jgi:hypothetical protein
VDAALEAVGEGAQAAAAGQDLGLDDDLESFFFFFLEVVVRKRG